MKPSFSFIVYLSFCLLDVTFVFRLRHYSPPGHAFGSNINKTSPLSRSYFICIQRQIVKTDPGQCGICWRIPETPLHLNEPSWCDPCVWGVAKEYRDLPLGTSSIRRPVMNFWCAAIRYWMNGTLCRAWSGGATSHVLMHFCWFMQERIYHSFKCSFKELNAQGV